MKKFILVNDNYQKNYSYNLEEEVGKHFHPEFLPELSPKEMLKLGVFGGKYFNDRPKEFPTDWFTHAKLSNGEKDIRLNFLK